jgi:hypothetical protein
MRTVYIIFASVGWAWFAVAAGYLWWRVRADRRGTPGKQGIEGVRHHAQ